MSKKRSNPHRPFMVFNTLLFFAVLAITVIFLYLAYTLKRDAERKEAYEGAYHIELAADFAGKSLSVYINDSLLVNCTMPDTLVRIDVNRFAEEHILMVVDNQTDNATSFNLNKEGGKIKVSQPEKELVIEEAQ